MAFEALLERAQELDPEALALLHDQLFPVVYKYVRYRLQDEQLCEDITSEVFVKLIENLHRRERVIKDVRAWLLGTASNLVNDYFRQKYRRQMDDLDSHANLPSKISTEGEAERNFSISELRQAMLKLTPDQQNVLAMRFSQDCSIEETANLVGKSVNAVKVLQFRALAALRRLLEEKWKK
jgi:RNA polymerase sigma-70 factor, ECF subfamily